MEQRVSERRVDIRERRRAEESRAMMGEIRQLRYKNALLWLHIAGPTARSLGRYAAKIEAMKDQAYRKRERRARVVRVFRAFMKIPDYEAVLLVSGTVAACWGLFYWLALR